MTQRSNTSRIAVSILLIAAISGCSIWNSWFGSEEINVGEYLTLQVEDTTDVQSISWVFSQLPDTSKLSGFLPLIRFPLFLLYRMYQVDTKFLFAEP